MTADGPGRIIRMHDLVAFAETEVAEKIAALESAVDGLREENRRLHSQVADYVDYKEIIELGKKIQQAIWDHDDARDNRTGGQE